MASFIYFYSKFTEEFLLLSAAGVFTLLSLYCYTWVVKKRRLGAARDQVPAGMVKVYLSQLINEAQFVRTQLFGLAGGAAPNADQFAAHFQAAAPQTSSPSTHSGPATEIPSDLLERLKALENQLADKESMVVNINVEKTKLLEEVEHLRQNEKVMGAAAGPSGNNDDLLQKIKALEERLEEYALFEDDLANLKRLQQENTQLKKQLEQGAPAAAPALAAAPAPARVEPSIEPQFVSPETETKARKEPSLDQDAIDALLNGSPATPPTPTPAIEPSEPEIEPQVAASLAEPIDISPKIAAAPAPAPVAAAAPTPTPKNDEFENLVDSIEDSLSAKPAAQVAAPGAAEKAAATQMSAPPQAATPIAEKTDEELLKEFENLLNS